MKKLYVEIADTPSKRSSGLMHRKHLSANDGMLFKFSNPSRLSFWMQNTYIPLDIAFLSDNGRILQIESMVPLSTRPVFAKKRCRYALEVNKGWFKTNGVVVGDRVAGEGISTRNGAPLKSVVAQDLGLGLGYSYSPTPSSGMGAVPNQGAQGFIEEPIGQQETQTESVEPDPDVMLNKTRKEQIEAAGEQGKSLLIMYVTKEGLSLPPKVISPPYEFESNEEGQHDTVLKAWDSQDASWKSFLIDNIIAIQDADEAQVSDPSEE